MLYLEQNLTKHFPFRSNRALKSVDDVNAVENLVTKMSSAANLVQLRLSLCKHDI